MLTRTFVTKYLVNIISIVGCVILIMFECCETTLTDLRGSINSRFPNMEAKVTKQLLKFLLRFRCPNCEFRTLDATLVQEHLHQCLKQYRSDFTDDGFEVTEDEFILNIKEELIETDHPIPSNVPTVIKFKSENPVKHDAEDPERTIEKEYDDKDFNFYCDICQKHFQTKGTTLKRHMHVHESPKFKCDQCPKYYKQNAHLWQHKRSVHQGLRHKCDHCKLTFISTGNLQTHIKAVHLNEKFKCDFCENKYSTRYYLHQHISSVHQAKAVRHNCDQCDKSFRQEYFLDNHIRFTHMGQKFKCVQCDKSFAQRGGLSRHRKTAHEGRIFSCDKCEKQFRQKQTLIAHILTHEK